MTSDVRALGRLSESLAGGAGGRRPRRRRVPIRRGPGPTRRRPLVPRSAALLLGAALAVVGWLAVAAGTQDDASPPAAETEPADVPARAAGEDSDRTSRGASRSVSGTFARVDDVALELPHPAPALVAFGAADGVEALAMDPIGRLVANAHDRYEPARDQPGPDYRVLASDGGSRAATSAADIVVPTGAPVVAPVDGRVVRVRDYAMEGGVRDYRIVIEVAEQPSLHVRVSYIEEPAVAVGDAVRAGETPLGVARLLPFTQGVDEHVDQRLPHVRIEVKPAGDPDPPDPNEPAAAPTGAARGR